MRLFLSLLLALIFFGCTINCKYIYVSSLQESYSLGVDSTQVVKVEKVNGSRLHGNLIKVYYK